MDNFIIEREMAEQEFYRFTHTMDLDVDESSMNQEDLEGFKQQKEKIIRAIQTGSVIINEAGEPVFTPRRTDGAPAIIFHEPDGAALMAMDRRKAQESIAKLYAAMAEITKVPAKTFANMKMPDLKICIAIVTLFLA